MSRYNAAWWAAINRAVLSTPVPGAASSDTDTSITVSWAAAANAASYTLQWREGSSGDWTAVANAASPHTVSGLTAGTSYQWRVRANAGAGGAFRDSEWSAIQSISTLGKLSTPTGLSATRTTTSITLSWGAVSGASTYTLQWREGSSGDWTAVSSAISPHAITGLTTFTAYQWRVRADAVGATLASDYTAVQDITTLPILTAPTNLTPTFSTTTVTLSWDAVTGAARYQHRIRSASDVDWRPWTDQTDQDASETLTGLTPGTVYSAQVRALDGDDNTGPESATVTFALSRITLPAPTGLFLTVTGSHTIVVAWNDVANATSYMLRWRAGSSATLTEVANVVSPYTLGSLDANTSHEVSVRAIGTGSYNDSAWTASVDATTLVLVEGPDVEGPDVEGVPVEGPNVEGPGSEGPDVEGPNLEGPHVEGPDVEGPDVEGPDVWVPSVPPSSSEGPDVWVPPSEGPDVEGPDVEGPDMEDSTGKVPPWEGPDVEGPDVEGPDVEGPNSPGYYTEGPDVTVPGTPGYYSEGPDLEGPPFEGPDVEGPDLEGPSSEGPDIEGPDIEGPDVPQ